MEPEIAEIPTVKAVAEPAVENTVTATPDVVSAEPTKKSRIPKKAVHVLTAFGVLVLTFAILTSFVYRHAPTDSSIRKVVGVVPYPAAVIGNHVITLKQYLDERDALNTYFVSSAAQSGAAAPDEATITKNVVDTMIHKIAVEDMAKAANITLDESKVDEFYANATGGADPAAFEEQLKTMFGWTPDEFKSRVVRAVVLASQMDESIQADATRQADRRAKAQAAYDRIAAGEDFAKVATDVSSDPSATAGGDVGDVKVSDIPAEWKDAIAAVAVGDYSKVVEGKSLYMVFKVVARTGKDADESVKLSLIAVPKETLEEATQEYLKSVRDWRYIGNT